ncbi:UDP-glucose 6-dehydrogenase [Bacillus sp. AFS002410]|uniref:UDP-glucose dehydrogenase family protein n=1 Tax=Bacillus sp. AFS002410 TaxID=2033481 RepID=UPI000BF20684|nr:UDP-glucose/GDP-mannose dehydrogenase family protein [Bacillus sp. AFS002410]PEJ58491.1 UDP-glucose 6-dehydrogenase [Bacillus sp. AFS002410]
MTRIVVAGTGYVGLSTGVSFATVGYNVTCVDIDYEKINLLQKGICPIFEPGLQEALVENISLKRIKFTTNYQLAYSQADIIFIAVGTPELPDGTANLSYLKVVAKDIAMNAKRNLMVVIKSTVPVGTNEIVKEIMNENALQHLNIDVISNPEFLREGSALYDLFNGDRIIIGSESQAATELVEELYKPFNLPIYVTDVRSAEMIKYASNAFLATKISFINEIAMVCENLEANVEHVAKGIGLDHRIGSKFLNAGIGYGGSCFPKDTTALVKEAELVGVDLKLLKSVITINNQQKLKLFEVAKSILGDLTNKEISLLGVSFKPNTNDIRHAPSITLINQFLKENTKITVYDPCALPELRKVFGNSISYSTNIEHAILDKEATLILTEWEEILQFDLQLYEEFMKVPLIIDGRNCFELDRIKNTNIHYYSIGRQAVNPLLKLIGKF